jgi:hypothetical protein
MKQRAWSLESGRHNGKHSFLCQREKNGPSINTPAARGAVVINLFSLVIIKQMKSVTILWDIAHCNGNIELNGKTKNRAGERGRCYIRSLFIIQFQASYCCTPFE